MRPAQVGPALVRAAQEFARERNSTLQSASTSRRGATLTELAERAQVGHKTARHLVPKLKSRGQLTIVGTRRVSYRNRPVAEYAPPEARKNHTERGWMNLGHCLANWTR